MSPKKLIRLRGETDFQFLERRLDALADNLEGVTEAIGKLASAKLLQQAFTGLILGALFTALVHVVGG